MLLCECVCIQSTLILTSSDMFGAKLMFIMSLRFAHCTSND